MKIDERVLAAARQNPEALSSAYVGEPERSKALIESDARASDVIALAGRRRTLVRFEELLADEEAFEVAREGGSQEGVWQKCFEATPWLLGVGLSGHLLTACDRTRWNVLSLATASPMSANEWMLC